MNVYYNASSTGNNKCEVHMLFKCHIQNKINDNIHVKKLSLTEGEAWTQSFKK